MKRAVASDLSVRKSRATTRCDWGFGNGVAVRHLILWGSWESDTSSDTSGTVTQAQWNALDLELIGRISRLGWDDSSTTSGDV